MDSGFSADRPPTDAGRPLDERRGRHVRCIACGGHRYEMTVCATETLFRCLDCYALWPERRTSRRLGAHCAPASEATHAAVVAICGAADTASAAAAALEWAAKLTEADRVVLTLRDAECSYWRDSTGRVRSAPLTDGEGERLPHEPLLLSELTSLEALPCAAGQLPAARSAVLVPLHGQGDPRRGALVAYWATPRVATVWHSQMLELIAEAMGRHLKAQASAL